MEWPRNLQEVRKPKIALEGIGLIGTENTYEVTEDSTAKSLTGDCETGLEINY